MITNLIIKNFAIIDHIEIEFHPGFNIVTGETGAGKSVIIGALQFLLGLKSDKDFIRIGTNETEVCGLFNLQDRPHLSSLVRNLLNGAGINYENNHDLIIKRIMKPRLVRNYINSNPVPTQLIKQLGDLLIDAHGPYDHQSLLKPPMQLALVASGILNLA